MLLNRCIYQTKHFIDLVHPMYNSGLIRIAFCESLFINRVDDIIMLICQYSRLTSPALYSSSLSLPVLPLKLQEASSSALKISSKHFLVYFFLEDAFCWYFFRLQAVSFGRLETMGEMLDNGCRRRVGFTGVDCNVSSSARDSGWKDCMGCETDVLVEVDVDAVMGRLCVGTVDCRLWRCWLKQVRNIPESATNWFIYQLP